MSNLIFVSELFVATTDECLRGDPVEVNQADFNIYLFKTTGLTRI
jgi:hypothetical protein